MLKLNVARIVLYTAGNSHWVDLLAHTNYHIVLADSVDRLSERLQTTHADLIILDEVAACTSVRERTSTFILAVVPATLFEAALDAGADDCVIHHDRLLVQRVNSILAATTQHKQTLAEVNKQRELAEALLTTTNVLNQAQDLNTVFDKILDTVGHVVPFESANIMVIEDETARIVRHKGYIEAGIDADLIDNMVLRLDTARNLSWVQQHKVPLRIADTSDRSVFVWSESAIANYAQSILTVPILNNGAVMGLINLDSLQRDAFTQDHEYQMMAFSNQAAIAMQRANFVEKLNQYTEQLERRVYERTNALMQSNAELTREIQHRNQIETQLKEERLLLRTIIDTIPDAIYVKDRDSRFLMINQAKLDHIPHITHASDVLGKTDLELYPDIALDVFEQEQRLIASGIAQHNKSHIRHNDDGSMTHFLITKLPIYDSQGTVVGLLGINHDITNLRQAETQLEQVLHSARCLLWSAKVVEKDGNYSWDFQIINEDAAQAFFPLDLQQHSYTEAWLAATAGDAHSERETMFANHVQQDEYNYTHEFMIDLGQDRQHWFNEDVTIHDLKARQWYVVGVCTNIDGRKRIEEQLQEHSTHLEQRVDDRTKQLTHMNQQLWDQVQERRRAEQSEREQRIIAETLSDNISTLSSTLERDIVFDRLLETIGTIVPHDAASIMLFDGEQGVVVRASGYDNQLIEHTYPMFENLKIAYKTRQAHIIPDVRYYEAWGDTNSNQWVRGHMSVPIIQNEEVLGFLNIDSREPDAFTQEHAKWMMSFAKQAGIAIRNAQYTEELEDRVQARTRDLELERAQLKAILNAMSDGVIYTDTLLKPYYINEALIDISGYSHEEWLDGRAQTAMNTPQHPQVIKDVWEKVLRTLDTQPLWKGETELLRKDGTIMVTSLVRTAVYNNDGERVGIVTTIRDISEEKLLQQQKARFITTAAHELRTPIANIKTRLFLMKRKPEQFNEHIAIAESVTNLMQNLVEHMFDLSRFERGIIQLNREQVHLQQLVREVSQFQEPEAIQRDISIILELPDAPITLYADPYRLTQVLLNLIGNALNYTPPHTHIILRVKVLSDENTVLIDVEDTGQGIDAEHLPHLFQAFFRVSHDSKGSGLGLAIVHEIVTAHGGTISVESEKGIGTRFMIRLPLNDTDEE